MTINGTLRKLSVLFLVIFFLLALTACEERPGVAAAAAETFPPAETASAQPTGTPTATPAPTATPTPTTTPAPTPFSLAWMSDTQEYAANGADIFCSMTQWIADSRGEWNTILTVHTGDLIRGSYREYEWDNMKRAFALLPSDMMVITVGGNHDLFSYTEDYTPYLWNRPDTDFDPSRATDDGLVYYVTFDADGVRFLVLSVSYGCEVDASGWINSVLAEYGDHYAILLLHDYLAPIGLSGSEFASAGKYLFGAVVEQNPNVRLVLCGHEHGDRYKCDEIDDDGDGTPDRTVHQMMFNLQAEAEGGEGYLRILRFDSAQDTIEAITYSPYLSDYGYDEKGGDGFGERHTLENAGLRAYLTS